MVSEVTVHGQSGYRRGCHCALCRAGHRESVAAWRAAKKLREAPDLPPSAGDVGQPLAEPLKSAPPLDLDAPPGAIEIALLRDIAEPDDKVAWCRTLVGMAKLDARLLDQVGRLDRLDIVSPVQLRMLEILSRLAIIGFKGMSDGDPGSIAADAEKMLAEMEGPGGG